MRAGTVRSSVVALFNLMQESSHVVSSFSSPESPLPPSFFPADCRHTHIHALPTLRPALCMSVCQRGCWARRGTITPIGNKRYAGRLLMSPRRIVVMIYACIYAPMHALPQPRTCLLAVIVLARIYAYCTCLHALRPGGPDWIVAG